MSLANQFEWQMLALINAERAKIGAGPLKLEITLNSAAEDHSTWMIETDTFSHTGIAASNPGVRIANAGFDFSGGYGWAENIAARSLGSPDGYSGEIAGLHEQLMNSPGHRANILNPSYDFIGIGFEIGEYEGRTWAFVTQKFAYTQGQVSLDTDNLENYELQFNMDFDDNEVIGHVPAGLDATGSDPIWGGVDWDILSTGHGDDTLVGGAERDFLIGGDGNDLLFGETGPTGLDESGALITRLYQATLGRLPDLAGHRWWTNALESGLLSFEEIISGFLNSDEFSMIYGATTNEQFVTLLYQLVLDRAPDSNGFQYWVRLLDEGQSREGIVAGFALSDEFTHNTIGVSAYLSHDVVMGLYSDEVFRLYEATLERTPDTNGFKYWADALANGTTLTNVVEGFVGSNEFQQKYGSLNDMSFVTLLYNNVLDRAPDVDGFQYWLSTLSAGTSRANVVLGFSESPEFKANTEDKLFEFLTTGAALDEFGDRLSGGNGTNALVGGLGSDEFLFDLSGAFDTTIVDLEPWDIIVIENSHLATVEAFEALLVQDGANTVYSNDDTTITLLDTRVIDVIEADQITFV